MKNESCMFSFVIFCKQYTLQLNWVSSIVKIGLFIRTFFTEYAKLLAFLFSTLLFFIFSFFSFLCFTPPVSISLHFLTFKVSLFFLKCCLVIRMRGLSFNTKKTCMQLEVHTKPTRMESCFSYFHGFLCSGDVKNSLNFPSGKYYIWECLIMQLSECSLNFLSSCL